MMLSSQEDREDARQAGVDEMLPKPAKESQLVSSIERLFAPKRNYAPSKLVKSNVGETVPCLRGRVLVAEDNVVNQKVIGLTLKRLGYESDLVSNGREALSALQVGRYNVVLMDCQMPVMDGFEATGLIRSSRMNMSNIPIIALTANALEGDRDKCIAAGMSDYLSKPISPTTLNKKLEEWMVWSESSVAVL